MASEALTAFLHRDFSTADHALLSLTTDNSTDLHNVTKLTTDPRIKHNAFVTAFYASPTNENLNNLVSFVSEFLSPDQRPTSTHDFLLNTTTDPPTVKFLYAHVGSVALYNIAVIAYHQRYLKSAACIGNLLYHNIDAMDDWLAFKTCFLLIDVYLRLRNEPLASTIANYADKLLSRFSKSHPTPSELKLLTPDCPARSQTILDSPVTYEDAKFCMHIYHARLCALEADPSKAATRKEAKNAVVAADNSESRPTAVALLVKAHVEHNYSKALRILASIVNQSPPHVLQKVRPLVLNSLGILHHRLGRHALAACYFEHSRQSFDRLSRQTSQDSSADSVQLTIHTSAKDAEVSFNLALQYMKLGDYARALDLFTICAKNDRTYANESPLLWLRMAECCVGIESAANAKQQLSVEGQGRGRRLIMRAAVQDDNLTLEYAATCARSAIAILDKQKDEEDANGPQKSNVNNKDRFGMVPNHSTLRGKTDQPNPTSSASDEENIRYRAAALTIMAYACLSFDPNAVIEACEELHKLYPKSDNDRCLLGRLYAAEAYCMLGRPDEAANQLAPLLTAKVSTDSSIREAAYVNMALTHVSNGDVASASRAAKLALKTFGGQSRHKVIRKEAIFAASYIFLRSGEVETARRCLRSLLGPAE